MGTPEQNKKNGKLGGRPKGVKNPVTLEKEAVLKELRLRIMRGADALFNAAKSSAIGNQFLYKIVTVMQNKKKVRLKPEIVTDPEEIRNYIDQLSSDLNTGEPSGDEDDDVYYFISTKEPNIQAFKELMDRAFGKSDAKIDLTTGGEKIVGINIHAPNKNRKKS